MKKFLNIYLSHFLPTRVSSTSLRYYCLKTKKNVTGVKKYSPNSRNKLTFVLFQFFNKYRNQVLNKRMFTFSGWDFKVYLILFCYFVIFSFFNLFFFICISGLKVQNLKFRISEIITTISQSGVLTIQKCFFHFITHFIERGTNHFNNVSSTMLKRRIK